MGSGASRISSRCLGSTERLCSPLVVARPPLNGLRMPQSNTRTAPLPNNSLLEADYVHICRLKQWAQLATMGADTMFLFSSELQPLTSREGRFRDAVDVFGGHFTRTSDKEMVCEPGPRPIRLGRAHLASCRHSHQLLGALFDFDGVCASLQRVKLMHSLATSKTTPWHTQSARALGPLQACHMRRIAKKQ